MAIVGRCPACGRRERRSTEQNNRYWAIVRQVAGRLKGYEGRHYGVDDWHRWFKFHFLGGEDRMLPNGYVYTEPRSTAEEDTPEFSDFMTQVEAWAAERGVFLDE
jgi:hypothetical protein